MKCPASIISFELDIDPNSLSVIMSSDTSYDSIKDLLIHGNFTESYVGTHNGKTMDVAARKSTQCYTLGLKIKYGDHKGKFIDELMYNQIKALVPNQFRNCIDLSLMPPMYSALPIRRYHAVKYETGCYFKRHSDSIESKRHFATVIVLIPVIDPSMSHNGGTLKVWDHNNTLHEFNSSSITKVTIIAFHPSLYHECTPITDGTRLIFKTDWKYDGELFDIAYAQNNGLTKMESIAEIGKHDVKQGSYNINKMIDHLRTVMETKKFAIIPLLNFYPIDDIRFLYKSELSLFNRLVKEFGKIGIQNLEEGDSYMAMFIRKQYKNNNNYRNQMKIVEFVDTQNFLNSSEPLGKKHLRSEYNDETYDHVYRTTYSCFIVKFYKKWVPKNGNIK